MKWDHASARHTAKHDISHWDFAGDTLTRSDGVMVMRTAPRSWRAYDALGRPMMKASANGKGEFAPKFSTARGACRFADETQ